MRNFDDYRPQTTAEAIDVLGRVKGARPRGGSTDLITLMKHGILEPPALVSLDGIAGFDVIEERDGALFIGAGATITEVAESPLVGRQAPAVAQAAVRTATPLVRNRATVGGNLCQRPRCWYFRHSDYLCAKKGGDLCYAIEGENKYHAIFDNLTCNIVHPSNLAPAFWVHGGVVHVQGQKGARETSIDTFFVLPEEDMSREVLLADDEVVTGVTLQPLLKHSGSVYLEVREKQSYDWALVCAAARIDLDGGRVADARLVVSAVAPVPLRREAAEAVLRGQPFSEELAWKAGAAAAGEATPLRDNAYKVRLLKACVAHALIDAHASAAKS